jgi:5-methylcytosine-specific restriction protein B
MAEQVRNQFFAGHGMTIQFHPAVTYEDFVIGLSPDPTGGTLRFDVRRGWLLEAAQAAKESPYLLVIDEVNRSDLGKVLGEAIYLFEPGEIGGAQFRQVKLPHSIDEENLFSIPENLYVLATMNTADRSIASIDLAVRRRFALDLLPGHAYFLAKDETELRDRFHYELLPLLDEYLRHGFLGPAGSELYAIRDAIEDFVTLND